jgi:CheY-like chemotaxis protein
VSRTTISKILYVDDDSDDCIFLVESFAAADKNTSLVCASDGEEAIRYLNSIEEENLPSLIILDLNMPRWDGRKSLNFIKSNPHYSNIPVVILSTSENSTDRDVCTSLGAAYYFQKPAHYDGYKDIVRNCVQFMRKPC